MLRSKPSRLVLVGPLTVLLLSLHAACAGGSSDTECERNSDCDHAYCSEGRCKKDCVDAALDCPKGHLCNLVGQCEFAGAGAGGAAGSSGAGGTGGASGAAGTGGVSATGGASGTAGVSGMAGASGTAGSGVSGTGGGSGTGGSGAAGTASGGAGNGGAGAAGTGGAAGQAGSPFGGGGGGTSKHELDPCTVDGDCTAPLVCRSDAKGGQARCTRACGAQADCFGGRRCETVQGTKACVKGDVGRPCAVADECNFACLLPQKYCTTTCNTGADCPSGYGCQGVGTPATRICVKLEAACDPSDTSACIAPAACDTSPSLVVAGCTIACDVPADCPQRAAGLPAWSCQGGLCRRPSDVKGPLQGGTIPAQYACDASKAVVNVCNDAQHLDFEKFTIPNPPPVSCSATVTTDGVPGDACVDTCRYQGGCSWGFTCTAVGNVGSARIGLCLVDGTQEPGAACSSGTQCAFGYCVNGKCSRDCSADGLCPTGTTCVVASGPPVDGLPYKRCELGPVGDRFPIARVWSTNQVESLLRPRICARMPAASSTARLELQE